MTRGEGGGGRTQTTKSGSFSSSGLDPVGQRQRCASRKRLPTGQAGTLGSLSQVVWLRLTIRYLLPGGQVHSFLKKMSVPTGQKPGGRGGDFRHSKCSTST